MDQKLLVFAGPYLGYGLSVSGDAIPVIIGGDVIRMTKLKFGSGNDNLKPFDFGLNGGVGYQYTNIFFKVQYNFGLANMVRWENQSWENSNLGVTVGYMFNL